MVRLSLAAPDELDDRRARRPRAGPAAAAPRRRGPRQLGARGVAGAARRRHPDHRGSRGDARRLVTVRRQTRPLPLPESTKGTVAMPAKLTKSIPACCPASRPTAPPAAASSAAAPPPRRRWSSGRRSWPPAARDKRRRPRSASRDAPDDGGPRQRHAADLELAAVHGRRLRRRVPDGHRADRRLQGRLQRQRGVVRQEQGAAVAQAGHRRRPGGAHPVHGRPPEATRLAQRDQRRRRAEQEEPAPRPARTRRSTRAASTPRPT